ncbi:MAG TPA: hypothetical protein VGP12_01025 [Nitrosospira sp.]|jgi:hypothetical protein|nr:hypothetical protein [Nitrosospira sp.]
MWRRLRWGIKFSGNGARRRVSNVAANGSTNGGGRGDSHRTAVLGYDLDALRSGRQYLLVLRYERSTLRLERKVCDQNRNRFRRLFQ